MSKPIVGITADIQTWKERRRCTITSAYIEAVAKAGGVPIILPPESASISEHIDLCHAFVLTGGDDPRTEPFGQRTHTQAIPVDPMRQAYESMLLETLTSDFSERPVLGVCLGMQMMALHAGGVLNQHLPDTHAEHAIHWDNEHEIIPTGRGVFARGRVHSRHRQAVEHPGRLTVLATAPDDTIEAICDDQRAFYIGVQWHPERTTTPGLGQKLFQDLIAGALESSA